MNKEDDFLKIGKKMPYTVPDGFFSGITGKTLEAAQKREQICRKKRWMGYSVSIAASFIALAAWGILFLSPADKGTFRPVAQKVPEILKQEDVPVDDHITLSGKNTAINDITHKYADGPDSSRMENVLASLSDEELLQWAMAAQNDLFAEETENNTP